MAHLVVGRVEPGAVVLLTGDHHVVEFPADLLPTRLGEGSIIKFTARLNEDVKKQRAEQFAAIQRRIVEEAEKEYLQNPPASTHKEITEVLPALLHLSGKKGPELAEPLAARGIRAFVYVSDAEPALMSEARARGEGHRWMHVSARQERAALMEAFGAVNAFIDCMRSNCTAEAAAVPQRTPVTAELAEAGVEEDGDGGLDFGGTCVLVCGDELAFGFVVAYLMETKGLSLGVAFRYVKARRPSVSPDFGFVSQLQSFEKQLRHHSDSSFLAQYVLDTLVGWEVSKDDLQAALEKHDNDVNLAIDSLCADGK